MSSMLRIASFSLAITAALAAPSASAIFLNTETFRAAGGDPNNLAATLTAGTEAHRRRAHEAPFDAVGATPGCTGTVLGVDDRHAWVLTAASCVGTAGWRQYSVATPTISASGWSRVHIPPQYAGSRDRPNDIALVSIPLQLPVAPQWKALTKPLLYDGNAEVGRTVHFVGTGEVGIGKVATPTYTRMWGTSIIGATQEDGMVLRSDYSPWGPTDRQALLGSGDLGSAGWQQQAGGYWTVVGVGAGDPYQSSATYFARINRHIDWIKRIFPGAQTFSERFTVTESRPFVSRNHGEDVDYGTVYYLVAPGQSGVQGPTSRTWIHVRPPTYSTITVTAKDAMTGAEHPVVLRASRGHGCGTVAMENGVICNSIHRAGPVTVSYDPLDNQNVPGGEWKAKFDIVATGWHRPYSERLTIHVDIRT